jgi:hypothetical protein
MSELTYILGAGASYQSMPVVKTFPSRFPLIKVFYVLIAYLVCMAILAYFGVR